MLKRPLMSQKVIPKAKPLSDYAFECNICMNLPGEPITTPCGHIFCWPCYYIAAPNRDKICCHVCRCEMYFHEVASLKITNFKERTTFLSMNGINIPPRPISAREVDKRRKKERTGIKVKHNGEVIFKVVITRNMVSVLVGIFIAICIVGYGTKNFLLGS